MATGISEFFLRRRHLLWLILAINFFSALYGFYWYKAQLLDTPWYLWLFTPDCPLAAMMMAGALGLYLLCGSRQTWYHTLTYTTLIKYGFWTVFVFCLYWLAGGKNYSFEYWMLCLSHLGMLIEGAIFIGSMTQRPAFWWLAASYSLLFDLFDYFYPVHVLGRRAVGTYPYLPNDSQRPIILGLTYVLTASFFLVAAVLSMRAKQRGKAGSRERTV